MGPAPKHSKAPHENRACHGWSRFGGICLVSGQDTYNILYVRSLFGGESEHFWLNVGYQLGNTLTQMRRTVNTCYIV